MKRTPPDPRIQAQKAAQRAALNALRRARRTADRAGVDLSDWEGEFLGSVEDRLKTYGRAFGDPEKGAAGAALSVMQTVKLKEISAKAKGETPKQRFAVRGGRPRRGAGRAGAPETCAPESGASGDE